MVRSQLNSNAKQGSTLLPICQGRYSTLTPVFPFGQGVQTRFDLFGRSRNKTCMYEVENTRAIRRLPHGPLEEVGREISYSGLTVVLAEKDEPVILGGVPSQLPAHATLENDRPF
jgi:hypothetical protein